MLPPFETGVNKESPNPPELSGADFLGRVGVWGRVKRPFGEGERRDRGLANRAARGEMFAAATNGRIEGSSGGTLFDDGLNGTTVEELDAEVEEEFDVLALGPAACMLSSFFRLARSCTLHDFLRFSLLSNCFRSSASFSACCASSERRGCVAVFVRAHAGTIYFFLERLESTLLPRMGEDAAAFRGIRVGERMIEVSRPRVSLSARYGSGLSSFERTGDVQASSGVR